MKNLQQHPVQDDNYPHVPKKDYKVHGVVIAIACIWLVWFIYAASISIGKPLWPVSDFTKDVDIGKVGQFGDTFGALNVLFTALAMAAVWWTGRMQRDEMLFQMDEQKITRAGMEKQAFESIFFQLIKLIGDHREALGALNAGNQITGLDWLRKECHELFNRLPPEVMLGDIEVAQLSYRKLYLRDIYNRSENPLGPYFRTLFYVFELIDKNNGLSHVEKLQYANLARAQLNANEIVLIASNGVGESDVESRKYIEKFGLLKHYPSHLHRDLIAYFFAESAFN